MGTRSISSGTLYNLVLLAFFEWGVRSRLDLRIRRDGREAQLKRELAGIPQGKARGVKDTCLALLADWRWAAVTLPRGPPRRRAGRVGQRAAQALAGDAVLPLSRVRDATANSPQRVGLRDHLRGHFPDQD